MAKAEAKAKAKTKGHFTKHTNWTLHPKSVYFHKSDTSSRRSILGNLEWSTTHRLRDSSRSETNYKGKGNSRYQGCRWEGASIRWESRKPDRRA